MKSKDRSLEIVAIGLGQAGGNLAAEFNRRGYRGLAFNTAHTDLTSLGTARHTLPDSQRIYIGIEGQDGAGSDVNYGRECIKQHSDRIRNAVQAHAEGADVVVLAAGLGGGTGSSVAEFTALLDELSLPAVVVTTLPHTHESGIAKVNALCGVRDLAGTPTYGWVLVDNARLAKMHHDTPIDSYFEKINQAIVDPIDVFNRLNESSSSQAIRALDGEDFRTLLLSGGVLNYHTQVLPQLSAESVVQSVRSALSANPMMPTGFDIANVAYLGLVIEASEKVLHESPFSLYEEVADKLKSETGGAAVYLGLYRQTAADQAGPTVRLLCSSNALPGAIDEMLVDAEREAGRIQHKVQQNVQALDLGGLEQLHLMRRPVRSTARAAGRPAPTSSQLPKKAVTTETPSSDDSPLPGISHGTVGSLFSAVVGSENSVTRQLPVKPPQPTPMKSRQQAPEPKSESQVEIKASETRMPAKSLADLAASIDTAPAAAPVAPEPGTAPKLTPSMAPANPETKVAELRRLVAVGDPGDAVTEEGPAEPIDASDDDHSVAAYRTRYERLAKAYREANGKSSGRIYIARELIAAQKSEDALERFYAVHAMSRIDPDFFREILENATQDADIHVADLAKQALETLAKAR